MTNKALSRRFFPAIARTNYYDALPGFSTLWHDMDRQWKEMERMMSLFQGAEGVDVSESKQMVYQDRSPEKEQDFSIWTKGSYPKLNINKVMVQGEKDLELKALQIIAAVPGCKREQVDVNILGGEITIESGIQPKPKEEVEEKKTDVIIHNVANEIPEGYRRVTIGVTGSFDFENAVADFPGDGTLVVTIPAKIIEKEKPRKLLS